MKWIRCILIMGVMALITTQLGTAQEALPPLQWVQLADWEPEVSFDSVDTRTNKRWYPYELLPTLDTLTLGYAYTIEDRRPALEFELSWQPGAWAYFENEYVRFEKIDTGVHMVSLDLEAAVVIDGAVVDTLTLFLDSLMLAPLPDVYLFETVDSYWQEVFKNASEGEARAYLRQGFVLEDLRIVRVAFAQYDLEEVTHEAHEARVVDVHHPVVYDHYPYYETVWIDWIIFPTHHHHDHWRPTRYRPVNYQPRRTVGRIAPSTDRISRRSTVRGRDETTGREGRGGVISRDSRRGSSSDKKDDDEDDDTELLPAALVGVAAVGAFAFLGGTIGYYGNGKAPIGIVSGFVRPEGGILLQVGINDSVLGRHGRERLVGKTTVFFDAFKSELKPAVGLGIEIEERGDDLNYSPAISFGIVGTFQNLVLMGGYDAMMNAGEFGIAINFRYKK